MRMWYRDTHLLHRCIAAANAHDDGGGGGGGSVLSLFL